MPGPVLAFGVPGVAGAVAGVLFVVWCKIRMNGSDAPIVVVDRRTMRSALRKIEKARRAGDIHRAAAGLTALSRWLGDQVAVGPRRYRTGYADLKKHTDAALAEARNALAVKADR